MDSQTIIGCLSGVIATLVGAIVVLAKTYVSARDKKDALEKEIREGVVPVLTEINATMRQLSAQVQRNTDKLQGSIDHERSTRETLRQIGAAVKDLKSSCLKTQGDPDVSS